MKLLVLLLCVAAASARVYERCQWAGVLKNSGMHGYHGVSLANWVCLTNWESHYNTQAINHNVGSTDYGIFQINSRWWCDDHQTKTANGCRIDCSELLTDNVAAAIACAKHVVQEQGISAWVAWRKHCQNQEVSKYLAGCHL
ncbi:lysozyme C-like [Nelusetta ayraudi]|uniref:lysozyme C-like n=1 Tax=Nelusetta ayraudi TaxID=303726 RepID=UPI003F72207B